MLWAMDDIACFLGMVECVVWPTPLTVNLTASWRWQWWHRWSQAPKISAKLAPWTCKRLCWGRSIESLWWGEVGFHLVTWMKVVPVSTKCIAADPWWCGYLTWLISSSMAYSWLYHDSGFLLPWRYQPESRFLFMSPWGTSSWLSGELVRL